jgi:heat shock protein HslJ
MLTTSCSLFTKTIKSDSELPSDRETVTQNKTTDTYHIKAIDNGDITGEWAISQVAGHTANGESTPYLMFDNGVVYGNNGCNTLNGKYSVNPADSTLRFSELITTMRLCNMTDLTDTDINTALDLTRRYTWAMTTESQYVLSLLGADGNLLMQLVRQDFDFLNGAWSVTAINGNAQTNDDVKLVFDIPELKLHGNTGCNILNGTIATDLSERNSISLQNIITTRRACPDSDIETSLLVALEDVVYARPIDTDHCELLNNQGETILVLKRSADLNID